MMNEHLMILIGRTKTRLITRVGGTEPIHIDIRIVAATNRNLPQMVEQGRFREKERLERAEYAILTGAYERYGSVRKAADSLHMPNSAFVRRRKMMKENLVRGVKYVIR